MKKNKMIRALRNIILVPALIALLYLTTRLFLGSTCHIDSPAISAMRMARMAEVDVNEKFKIGLTRYRLDVGTYLSSTQGLEALIQAPKEKANRWKGPYMEETTLTDPWGNPYQYQYPGKYNMSGSRGYDLWSWGPDGVESNDDIGNWKEPRSQSGSEEH